MKLSSIIKLLRPRYNNDADDRKLVTVVIYGTTCRLDKALSALISSAIFSGLRSLKFVFHRIPLKTLINRLEALLTTYDVILERNPARAGLKARRDYVEKLVVDISRRGAIIVSTIIEFEGVSCDEAKSLLSIVSLHDCEYTIMCGDFKAYKLKSHMSTVTTTDTLLSIVSEVDWLKTPIDNIGVAIVVGYDARTNAPVFLPLMNDKGALHTLIVGPTGSGKTTLLSSVIARVSLTIGVAKIHVIDPKGDLVGMVGVLEERGIIDHNIVDIHDLSSIPEEEKTREIMRILQKLLYSRQGRQPLRLLVVDEAWRLTRLAEAVEAIVREARSKNIALIMASQSPSDYTLTLWGNVWNVIVLASNSSKYVEQVSRYIPLDESSKEYLLSGRMGRALYWSRSLNRPIPVELQVEPLVLKHR